MKIAVRLANEDCFTDLCGAGGGAGDAVAVLAGQYGRGGGGAVTAQGGVREGLDAHEDPDVAAQLLHQVVQLPPGRRLAAERRLALRQHRHLDEGSHVSVG